jgi:photosystem II stability/assembly factor-like uncharacterized protein
MKKSIICLFAAVVILGGMCPSISLSEDTWINTGGPLGGLGYDVRIDPTDKNIMFVTDNWSGVNRSTDAGSNWEGSNSGIDIFAGPTGDAVPIFSLTIDPNDPTRVWAGTFGDPGDFGIFRSDNGGISWTKKINGIDLGDDVNLVFRGFTIQEGNSDIVYAQASVQTGSVGWNFDRTKGRIYKSVDGGENWLKKWEGNHLARYVIIDPVDPDILYASTGIFDREAFNSDCESGVLGGVGVLKSTDGGDNWFTINNGIDDTYVGCLRMHPTNRQILYAATAGIDACLRDDSGISGLYRTTDGGASWTKVLEGNKTTVNFSPSNPDVIYAGFENAFHRSTDGGDNWRWFSKESVGGYGPEGIVAGIPIDVIVHPEDPYTLYVNNYGGGVFRSTDGAETWESWSRGYTGADVRKVHMMTGNPSIVYSVTSSGPFVSTNGGVDWVGVANGDASAGSLASGVSTIAVHPTNPNIILFSSTFHGVIYRSDDGGADFREIFQHSACEEVQYPPHQGFKTIVFSPSNPNIVYAGLEMTKGDSEPPVGAVICKSTDTGISWIEIPSIIDGINAKAIAVHPTDPAEVYCGSIAGMFKTTDGGGDWVKLQDLGDRNILSIAIDPFDPQIVYAGERDGGVWKSTDMGQSWDGPRNTGFSSGNPSILGLAVDPLSHTTVYAGDWTSGVYCSIDGGETWAAFPDSAMTGLLSRAVQDLSISDDGTVIYAATAGGGVFRYGEIPTGIDESEPTPRAPNTFSVAQNYPNPFNPSTTIALNISGTPGEKQHVEVTIYDIRGRRVCSLIDSDLEPGNHKIHWNGQNDRGEPISSGIYLYTLKTKEGTFTRKMTILK